MDITPSQTSPASMGDPAWSASPFGPFNEWLTQALEQLPMANAMGLATATRSGETALRTVMLKAYSDEGFVFFTSPDTLKVRHVAENPHVSLLFFWPGLNRQIRIDGTAARIPVTSLARRFFSRRAHGSAITWVSQGGRIANAREALEISMSAASHPPCAFLVSPATVMFWQGGAGRQHASLEYTRAGEAWTSHSSGSLEMPRPA